VALRSRTTGVEQEELGTSRKSSTPRSASGARAARSSSWQLVELLLAPREPLPEVLPRDAQDLTPEDVANLEDLTQDEGQGSGTAGRLRAFERAVRGSHRALADRRSRLNT
jgi:hypothetical protein